MDLKSIKRLSPLYEYWSSEQNQNDETNRISKTNKESKISYLFIKEPYKWENLFQSIIIEINRGDADSIKGLKIILDCINLEEKEKVLLKFSEEKIFNSSTLEELRKPIDFKGNTKKNLLRFIRILFSIFTNPYGIEQKRNRIHLYEKTGFIINECRKFILKGKKV